MKPVGKGGKIGRLLIANRGEIAVRILHSCQRLGIETVLAVSEADQDSLPARLADRCVCIGPPPPSESYLNISALVMAALATGCDGIHPGYGFLSESASFAEACVQNGLTFVGPPADVLRLVGDKVAAKQIARAAAVPTIPSSPPVADWQEASAAAGKIGYPVMVKAVGGGGGRGIFLANDAAKIRELFAAASQGAREWFGADGGLYVERCLPRARHIEVQVAADRFGRVAHLGERECSVQRRFQKVIEETPAPRLPRLMRTALHKAAVEFARECRFATVGTVEFLVDGDCQEFFFLEMNPRIQVEHPVTEAVTGIDLVSEQIKLATGAPLTFEQAQVEFVGHAIECRITAESPLDDFAPSPGRITAWRPPGTTGIRVDSHCYPGYLISPYYDSLIAKVISHGRNRTEAISRMASALKEFVVEGIETTLGFQRYLIGHADFASAVFHTNWLEDVAGADYRRGRESPVGAY